MVEVFAQPRPLTEQQSLLHKHWALAGLEVMNGKEAFKADRVRGHRGGLLSKRTNKHYNLHTQIRAKKPKQDGKLVVACQCDAWIISRTKDHMSLRSCLAFSIEFTLSTIKIVCGISFNYQFMLTIIYGLRCCGVLGGG
ncbi:hypothetical protein SELMODRAFT_407020 [Selaginella moellendorffii]|uniref:Uncharacterized protein n=1 Tax=Selaginella moellendorffii TaxID=88036 RepID=D8R3N0_SELML|nr:hypothetical protein SELMODRAFT_407020 [Selaginella moellendorffii]